MTAHLIQDWDFHQQQLERWQQWLENQRWREDQQRFDQQRRLDDLRREHDLRRIDDHRRDDLRRDEQRHSDRAKTQQRDTSEPVTRDPEFSETKDFKSSSPAQSASIDPCHEQPRAHVPSESFQVKYFLRDASPQMKRDFGLKETDSMTPNGLAIRGAYQLNFMEENLKRARAEGIEVSALSREEADWVATASKEDQKNGLKQGLENYRIAQQKVRELAPNSVGNLLEKEPEKRPEELTEKRPEELTENQSSTARQKLEKIRQQNGITEPSHIQVRSHGKSR